MNFMKLFVLALEIEQKQLLPIDAQSFARTILKRDSKWREEYFVITKLIGQNGQLKITSFIMICIFDMVILCHR
ncbi:hypothetical protein T4D_11462 [Trichinella pseudospiralis]|uniref:Uncharacterized protein n=1 Tax=Trichinella pseudospiralis TaxID=6337 RepID=A0A0V1FZB9_TRIPS|nr:hypothetical protein T4D_11462 [Trichinella pseudospiralis]